LYFKTAYTVMCLILLPEVRAKGCQDSSVGLDSEVAHV